MELNFFITELESALQKKGIPSEIAKRHVKNLSRSFTEEDLSEIENMDSTSEIEDLADSISVIFSKKAKALPGKTEHTEKNPTVGNSGENIPPTQINEDQISKEKQTTLSEIKNEKDNSISEKSHLSGRNSAEISHNKPTDLTDNIDSSDEYDYSDYSPEIKGTTKGITTFWVGFFLTLPVTLSILAILFIGFAAIFASLIVILLLFICALIGTVASGAGISLIGIIYGVTQLFSFTSAGIYEIGLGIITAGCALFISVLLYNCAVRFLPWVMRKTAVLFKFACFKIKSLYLYIKRWCYKI